MSAGDRTFIGQDALILAQAEAAAVSLCLSAQTLAEQTESQSCGRRSRWRQAQTS